MDQKEFNELHSSCVSAFKSYVAEAEITATMLADCTAEPMPLAARLNIALQERIENMAHAVYLSAKAFLHEAARLGFAFTGLE
jgi:negative regulator of sigma E activity